MSSTILAGDITVYYAAENNQKRIRWTGSATGTRTVNQLYSALQNLFDDPAQLDDLVPMRADTPDIYRIQNQWFVDDDTVEHLTGGSLYSDKWKDGTTEHVLVIGYSPTTEFNAADIGRTIRGATTGDTGTILDFNATRDLIWIRPDDPAAAGDEFDNGTESYSVGIAADGDPAAQVWQVDASPLGYVDETADFNSAAVNDVEVFPATEAIGDWMAFGYEQQFSRLRLNVGTAGDATGVVAWEYWNGTTWAALTVTDGTSGLETAGTNNVDLTVPSDWVTSSINGSAQLYYIRVRVTTVFTTTNPLLTQGWMSGVGAGAFVSHTRHGAASVAGESAWAGVSSIGTIQPNSHVYIFAESPNQAAGGFNEVKVIATKGTSDWWSDGQIDLLLKVKEAGSVFGQLPGSSPATAVATFLVRQYSKTYTHFIASALATAGGNTVVPFSASADLDNATGYRQMALADSSGNWAAEDRIRDDGDATIEGIITSVSGANPTITLQYYLYGDPLNDFTGATGAFSNLDDTGAATAVAPTNVGPASDTTITTTFGITTQNINNGSGAREYSVRINPASLAIERVYERMKYITRRGSTEALQGQDGEEYVGGELQLTYDTQTGNFTQGLVLTGGTSLAKGVIVADQDNGTSGYLIVKAVRGTFAVGEVVTDTSIGSATVSTGGLRTITPVAGAPFGTFAGGKFFGAPTVCLTTANLASGDEQAYQLIDNTGATQLPPNTVSVTVTNLISSDTVSIFRRTGTAVKKNDFTTAGGANNIQTFTLTVNAAPSTEYPTTGKVRVISSSGEEHRYRYTAISGSAFTLDNTYDGFVADAAGGSATVLVDTGANFVTNGVEVGDYVYNQTQTEYVRVVSVDSEAQLTTEALSSGDWNSDTYDINSMVETYPNGQNVYVPFIERIANATSESTTMVHTSDVTVRVDVRRSTATAILPFSQDTSIVSTGLSVPAIRTEDTIIT